jgi:hypothetical protein
MSRSTLLLPLASSLLKVSAQNTERDLADYALELDYGAFGNTVISQSPGDPQNLPVLAQVLPLVAATDRRSVELSHRLDMIHQTYF